MIRLAMPAMALAIAGCGVIAKGTNQTVSIETEPKAGAVCQAANSKGAWHLPETPGSLTVAKAYGELTVTCTHPDGSRGEQVFTSETVAAPFGNILLGGVPGIVADISTGAAYEYPQVMKVVLRPAAGR